MTWGGCPTFPWKIRISRSRQLYVSTKQINSPSMFITTTINNLRFIRPTHKLNYYTRSVSVHQCKEIRWYISKLVVCSGRCVMDKRVVNKLGFTPDHGRWLVMQAAEVNRMMKEGLTGKLELASTRLEVLNSNQVKISRELQRVSVQYSRPCFSKNNFRGFVPKSLSQSGCF